MRWVFCQRPETVKPERLYEYITLRRERFCIHTMIVGGFTTVTITSVFIAGWFATLL